MNFNQPREMYPGMWRYPMNPDLCCIYRVPNRLREVNPEPYTPQIVLIGPLHHSVKSQALKALYLGDDITYTKSMAYLDMEEHKKTYLAEFAARIEGETTIDELRRMIKEEEETIRASYQESTAWIQSSEFVEMVLHDSVFIIEFILRFSGVVEKKGDPLLAGLSLGITVYHDLILLENQLPFFILDKLFNPIVRRIWPHLTFRDLIISFFGFQGKIGRNSKFRHFTDLTRCVRVETLPNLDVWKSKPIEHMYNAEKLDSGGVKFKAVGNDLSLCVSFKNGCLKIPCLTVDDSLEMKLRNIMALEQCHYPNNAHVCSYALFLDYLIDTDKDVDLLLEKGILKSWIRQPAKVAQMVNKLVTGIVDPGSYYYDIAGEVNEYYRNPVNRSKAILKRVYFGNPWTGTATIAAMFLLVMTLIQTWASIVQAGRIIAQFIVMGTGILGRAVFQAYRQAIANASKTGVAQEAMQNAVRKAGKAINEQEARQILGVTEHTSWEEILQKYDKLFENNAKAGSFYLQSKVLRAKECLEVVYRSNGTPS